MELDDHYDAADSIYEVGSEPLFHTAPGSRSNNDQGDSSESEEDFMPPSLTSPPPRKRKFLYIVILSCQDHIYCFSL